MVNRREAIFWKDIINEFGNCHLLKNKEKFKRLTKNVKYKSLCDMCEKLF